MPIQILLNFIGKFSFATRLIGKTGSLSTFSYCSRPEKPIFRDDFSAVVMKSVMAPISFEPE